MFRLPPYLQSGDTVAIVATARKISKKDIQPFIDLISSWNLKVELGKTIGLADNQFAGTDAERAEDIQRYLDDASIKAIICARGGYGTVRIIDRLNFKSFKKSPKWICGFSDVTVLHNHLQQNEKTASIHCSMPIQIEINEAQCYSSLQNALFGKPLHYSFEKHYLNRNGNAVGKLIGGNLSMLYSLAGSETDIKTKNKILLIEDLDEYLYHTDRMMQQLKRSGKLKNLAALLVGTFSDMKDNDIPFGKTAEEIISDTVKEYNYPVIFNAPLGHGKLNVAVRMGQEIGIKANEKSIELTQD